MLQKEFISKLRDFGLNTYESKLWAALLSRGISTAGELSDIANVPRSRSYDVLESLEKKGFIIMKLGKPIKYIAVSPIEVVERVKKRVQEEAKVNIGMLDSMQKSSVLDELNQLHNQGIDIVGHADLSGSLKGRNSLYNHLESLIKEAQHSIHILTTTEGLVRKSDSLFSALQKAKKKNVSIKIAAPISKKITKFVKHLLQVGEVRHTNMNGRFVIIDNKDVVFMLSDDTQVHPHYDMGVWVATPYFAQTLTTLFSKEWKTMTPFSKNLK